MDIRPATADDVRRYHDSIPYSAVVLAGLRDGEVIGVGGVYYSNGAPVVFSGFCDGMTKREIVKGARAIMGMLRGVRGPVYAKQDAGDKPARTLAHFGFSPLPDGWWVKWHE